MLNVGSPNLDALWVVSATVRFRKPIDDARNIIDSGVIAAGLHLLPRLGCHLCQLLCSMLRILPTSISYFLDHIFELGTFLHVGNLFFVVAVFDQILAAHQKIPETIASDDDEPRTNTIRYQFVRS